MYNIVQLIWNVMSSCSTLMCVQFTLGDICNFQPLLEATKSILGAESKITLEKCCYMYENYDINSTLLVGTKEISKRVLFVHASIEACTSIFTGSTSGCV